MKLVREHIDFLNFTKDGDPIQDMNMGAKNLIEKWLTLHKIDKYEIAHDLLINTHDTIVLDNLNIDNLPYFIIFNNIKGGFHIKNNRLVSLKGIPRKVSGSFVASYNKLKTLFNSPIIIEESFAASNNKLVSLEGITQIIGRSIYIHNNKLKSLKYIPSRINGNLYIYNNPIETLNFFPVEIYGDLKFSASDILSKEKILKITNVHGNILEQ